MQGVVHLGMGAVLVVIMLDPLARWRRMIHACIPITHVAHFGNGTALAVALTTD